MTNLIIASFSEEAQATEASHKLDELETIGDITIYEMALVKKPTEGEAVVLQADDATEGLRTLSGAAIGGLIGTLAGPVGALIGMLTGTLAGEVAEDDHYGFTEEFLAKAIGQMQPGSTAVIAEIDEDNEIFVNSSLTPLGATLIRTDVDYEYDEQSDEEMEEYEEDIAAQRAKIKSATAEEKSKIEKKIAKLKERRKDRINELKEKVKEAASHIKVSEKDRKISKIRSNIEKHQKKIAALENKLQKVLGKDQKEADQKEEVAH
jgi:uncharacterized membrane protein